MILFADSMCLRSDRVLLLHGGTSVVKGDGLIRLLLNLDVDLIVVGSHHGQRCLELV